MIYLKTYTCLEVLTQTKAGVLYNIVIRAVEVSKFVADLYTTHSYGDDDNDGSDGGGGQLRRLQQQQQQLMIIIT